jgi:FMN phosphatase YigB (HAD superfamily)
MHAVVFLVDVDNTVLDNDRIRSDLQDYLAREFGPAVRDRYWEIQERLFVELGYREYLGAVQRYWLEHPEDPQFLEVASHFLRLPFADYLFPDALETLAHLRSFGPVVVLTDGDAVFQPWKIERSEIREAVQGNVLVYVHKEQSLDDVEHRYPAEHYVAVDDKPRLLVAAKEFWGDRVTTVLPRQGQFASDPEALALNPAPDLVVERVGDLLSFDPTSLLTKMTPG